MVVGPSSGLEQEQLDQGAIVGIPSPLASSFLTSGRLHNLIVPNLSSAEQQLLFPRGVRKIRQVL